MAKENVVYIYTTEYYSASKNEILSFATKQIQLETIKINEINKFQKHKHVFSDM